MLVEIVSYLYRNAVTWLARAPGTVGIEQRAQLHLIQWLVLSRQPKLDYGQYGNTANTILYANTYICIHCIHTCVQLYAHINTWVHSEYTPTACHRAGCAFIILNKCCSLHLILSPLSPFSPCFILWEVTDTKIPYSLIFNSYSLYITVKPIPRSPRE